MGAQVKASGSLNPQQAVELGGIDVSLGNLLTFPFIEEAVRVRGQS